MIFIGEHGILHATHGTEEVTRWKLGADRPGKETRHVCRVTNIALPICPVVHTLHHGWQLRQ